MTIELLKQSFYAINSNAASHLLFTLSTSWWLVFLIIGCVATSIMGVQSVASKVEHEEQNIL